MSERSFVEFTNYIIDISKKICNNNQKSEWRGIWLLKEFIRPGNLKYQGSQSENHERIITLLIISALQFIKCASVRKLVHESEIFKCIPYVSTSKEKLNKLCCHAYDIKCPKKMFLIIYTFLSISYGK